MDCLRESGAPFPLNDKLGLGGGVTLDCGYVILVAQSGGGDHLGDC